MEIKGCFWHVSDHVPVKKVGVSGNLEPKFYKIIINLVEFLYFYGNGIPKSMEERSWYGNCRETTDRRHGTEMLQPPVPSPGPIKGLFVVHKKPADN